MSTQQLANSPGLAEARERALSYEAGLDPIRRKRMGQFFTGLPLSRLLAALSVREGCSRVIDPMAGHGDLLDAVFERCAKEGHPLLQVDAIEMDPATADECRNRLRPWSISEQGVALTVHANSAFKPDFVRTLPDEGYDLVITNPPYVRYQIITNTGRNQTDVSAEEIRKDLLQVVMDRAPSAERRIWRDLVLGYSGLSDLSVPAWLLAAVLVKPGGVLALVAPATWRNRDYADVLQYLLSRCFQLDAVVADKQPGWFSEALVRTHLIMATRLDTNTISVPLRSRGPADRKLVWAEVDPAAGKNESLVGKAFDAEDPEGCFAAWLLRQGPTPSESVEGVVATKHFSDEIIQLKSRRARSWLKKLDPDDDDTPLFGPTVASPSQSVPYQIKQLLPAGADPALSELGEIGIQVSQGLRTGCNDFFYVELIEQVNNKEPARVRCSRLFDKRIVTVPLDVLRPVLRRQSELCGFAQGATLKGCVLDLRKYVLPEDHGEVEKTRDVYRAARIETPRLMLDDLADLVRQAAKTSLGTEGRKNRIPKLSAVKTNVRTIRRLSSKLHPPRFWYMLPDFTRRHLPDAFIPRINQETPRVLANRKPPILIDANFSTLWATSELWTAESIVGILSSTWARACMEAIGTPMGGGALKLEATHLRRLPIPRLAQHEIAQIADLAPQNLPKPIVEIDLLAQIDRVIARTILPSRSSAERERLTRQLRLMTDRMQQARQRR